MTEVESFPFNRREPSLLDHDYSIRCVDPEDLPSIKKLSKQHEDKDASSKASWLAASSLVSFVKPAEDTDELENRFTKKFSKCDRCRRSRTKVLVPNSLLSIAHGKNDGVTCDFCGDVMDHAQPQTLPDVFEGRRGSKGGDSKEEDSPEMDTDQTASMQRNKKSKSYVYCGECGKVVLRESLTKHLRDVHEKSNRRQCGICRKWLSGPFSLKEHIGAVHNKQTRHTCKQCGKMFAHFSNMNRHVRLVHEKMVVTHKYINCNLCHKVVQSTSLKKHMAAIHEQRRDFRCGFCGKSFAQSYTLKEHTAAKHTFEYGHTCSFCGKAFAHKTNCGRHLRTVHKEEIKDKFDNDLDMVRAFIRTQKVPKIEAVDPDDADVECKIKQEEEDRTESDEDGSV